MMKFMLCVIFCLYVFLCRDVNGQCPGSFQNEEILNRTTVGKYFSLTSETPGLNAMLKGSGKIFKGPAGDDVTVTVKGMLYVRYFNAW